MAHIEHDGSTWYREDFVEELEARIESLEAALRHALVCSFPEEVRFRCEGCVAAERALAGV